MLRRRFLASSAMHIVFLSRIRLFMLCMPRTCHSLDHPILRQQFLVKTKEVHTLSMVNKKRGFFETSLVSYFFLNLD